MIYDNEKIWRLVGGPDPEALLAPTAEALALVQETCSSLEKLVEAGPRKLGLGNILIQNIVFQVLRFRRN